jgi:protein-S-isoprenylcysteine O-methyltransferase Ste14
VTVSSTAAARQRSVLNRSYWADLLFGRTLPALFFGLFLVYQLIVVWSAGSRLTGGQATPDDYLAFLNRVLRLAFFTMLIVMYVVRLPSQRADRRPLVILVSLIGTFAILATSYLPSVPRGPGAVLVSDVLITFGMAWAVWGLAYLRRSFSIIPEARKLVTGGPYAHSRNPLYFGEGIASIGVMLPVFGPWQALLLLIFIASQALRIRWEQKVLLEAFGEEFKEYLRRVPVLVPFWPVKR